MSDQQKDRNPSKLSFSVSNKTSSLIMISDLSTENIIQILSKKKNERTFSDILIISRIIEESDLVQKLKKDKIEQTVLDKLILFVAQNMQYEYIKEDKFLFKKGDIGDTFYIILTGSVTILKSRERIYNYDTEEYYTLLKNYLVEGHQDLFDLTVKKNQNSYPISEKESNLRYFEEVLLKIRLHKGGYYLQEESMKIKKNIDIKKKMSHLQIDFIRNRKFPSKSEMFIRKHSLIPENEHKKTSENYFEKKQCVIYENYPFLIMKKGEHFGDYALHQENKRRTATVFAEKQTHLMVLNAEIYENYVKKEKNRMKSRDMNFLLHNFFLRSIKIKLFELKYFENFISLRLTRGDILYSQNDELDSLFFINYGEVELTIYCSIQELFELANSLLVKLNLKQITSLEYRDDILEKKIKMKLLICGSGDILGAEEYYFRIKRFCKAKVLSEDSKIWKLNLLDFKKIIKDDYIAKESFDNLAYKRADSLVNTMKNVYQNNLLVLSLEMKNKRSINFSTKINYNHFTIKHNITYSNFPNTKPLQTKQKISTLTSKHVAKSRNKNHTSELSNLRKSKTNRIEKNMSITENKLESTTENKYDDLQLSKIRKEISNLTRNKYNHNHSLSLQMNLLKDSFVPETKITPQFLTEKEIEFKEKIPILNFDSIIGRETRKIVKVYDYKKPKENFNLINFETIGGEELIAPQNRVSFKNAFKLKVFRKNRRFHDKSSISEFRIKPKSINFDN